MEGFVTKRERSLETPDDRLWWCVLAFEEKPTRTLPNKAGSSWCRSYYALEGI